MGHYLKVKELPPAMIRALSDVGYGRKDIEIKIQEKIEPRPPSADGRKGFVAVCFLDDSAKVEIRWGSYGGSNPFTKSVDDIQGSIDIPRNVAFILGLSSGGHGYPAYATAHVHPGNMNPSLLPAPSDISDREKKILAIFKSLKSSYRKEYLDQMKVKNEEIQSLIDRGFLKKNKAGSISITVEGKNNAGRNYF